MKRALLVSALGVALLSAAAWAADDASVVGADRVRVRGHEIALHGVEGPRDNRARCDGERVAAARARARLEELLVSAREVEITGAGMSCLLITCDASVTVDGVDLSQTMLDGGYVKPKGDSSNTWCEGEPIRRGMFGLFGG